MAERQLGPFVLGEKLGGGGMGVVYRARYTKTGQNVALKILPASMSDQPRMVARFERELEILKKLRHPNIVPCFGGGKIGNQHYFTMELVEGGSLTDELKKRGRIPWEETIGYGLQICAALEHAHDKGIVHRDLKPSNLLLTKDQAGRFRDRARSRCDRADRHRQNGRDVSLHGAGADPRGTAGLAQDRSVCAGLRPL
jgi:eukaryotic-like serine/threonine-protein kinase